MDKNSAKNVLKESSANDDVASGETLSAISNSDTTSLNQVRDLLFGADLKSQQTLLQETESQLKSDIDELKKLFIAKLSDFEKKTAAQFSDLNAQLKQESKARTQDVNKLNQALNEARKTTQEMVQQASSEAAAAEEKLASEISLLESDMSQRFIATQEKIDGAEAALDDAKVDRSSLASLLVVLANEIEKDNGSR